MGKRTTRTLSGGYIVEFDETNSGTQGRIFHGDELVAELNAHLVAAATDFLNERTSANVRVSYSEFSGRFAARIGDESVENYAPPKKRAPAKRIVPQKRKKKLASEILKSVPMNRMDTAG